MTIKPSDSVSWFQVLQRGQHYMKTWPADKRLAPVFPENRVTVVTRFGIRFMPPLAIFTLTWQIALGGQLGPAIATALFACGLPLQGLWWLGKRAITPLPLRYCSGFMKCVINCSKQGKRSPHRTDSQLISLWLIC